MGWVESNDSPGNVAAIEFNVPYSGAASNVAILTGNNVTPNTWMFDNTGNLVLPSIGGNIEASITTVFGALQMRSNVGTEMDYYDSAEIGRAHV